MTHWEFGGDINMIPRLQLARTITGVDNGRGKKKYDFLCVIFGQ